MINPKHEAREPWTSWMFIIYDANGCEVAECMSGVYATDEDGAHAHRIVECVNACAGIADPVNTIEGTRKALQYLVRRMELKSRTSKAFDNALVIARLALSELKGEQP